MKVARNVRAVDGDGDDDDNNNNNIVSLLFFGNEIEVFCTVHFHSFLLIPWSRVLLEKLTGSQLVKKFLAFYVTRMFITALNCHYPETKPVYPPPHRPS